MDVTVFGVAMVLHETRFHPTNVTVQDKRYCVFVRNSFILWQRLALTCYSSTHFFSLRERRCFIVIQWKTFPLLVSVQPQIPEFT